VYVCRGGQAHDDDVAQAIRDVRGPRNLLFYRLAGGVPPGAAALTVSANDAYMLMAE
jgi:hypothetical protein